jgi:hypothetical protein
VAQRPRPRRRLTNEIRAPLRGARGIRSKAPRTAGCTPIRFLPNFARLQASSDSGRLNAADYSIVKTIVKSPSYKLVVPRLPS